jgi:hypothetical protein
MFMADIVVGIVKGEITPAIPERENKNPIGYAGSPSMQFRRRQMPQLYRSAPEVV